MNWLDWLRSFVPTPRPAPPRPPLTLPFVPPPAEGGDPVVARVNLLRASLGLARLADSPDLASVASGRARRMAAAGDLSHQGFDAAMAAAGLSRDAYGECIESGLPDPRSVVASWAGDPPHRAILLGPYSRGGSGLSVDRNGRPYWSLILATGLD